MSQRQKIKIGRADRLFHICNGIFLILCIVVVAVPMMNIISQSISNPSAVLNGKVTLLPVEPTLKTYGYVFGEKSIMTGYLNSIYYTAFGTIIAVILSIFAAYPLSRKDFVGRNLFTFLFTFTMLFQAGMIPTYLVVKNLNMIDSIWAVILPTCISAYNIIIARTFFINSIPHDLYEAAEIDGANDFTCFFRIALPLSKSIMAILVLLFAVWYWNIYFDAMIYLTDSARYPLQLVLRNIMTSAQTQSSMVQATGISQGAETMALTESLKYATIICASVPLLILYPFIQKHFTKGMMIGTLKG